VALDRHGRLAAATSTGGTLDKLAGRVGDTPLIGAATWADARAAVSCTGHGEYFIRAAVAHDVAARMAYRGDALAEAARAALDTVRVLGGDGGLIAVDRAGNVAMPFNSGGMKRGVVRLHGAPEVAVY
jgi:isoaspartyl peptidase/L-asparaginase-like protein (Ntn-hydrolase superfamily)